MRREHLPYRQQRENTNETETKPFLCIVKVKVDGKSRAAYLRTHSPAVSLIADLTGFTTPITVSCTSSIVYTEISQYLRRVYNCEPVLASPGFCRSHDLWLSPKARRI